MKTWIGATLFVLSICCFLFPSVGRASLPTGENEPEEGRMVAVTAEQEVDIQNNDVAGARVLAFSLAVRQAVEKAYGTYVKVEELPEGRKIIAQAAAGLKYTILAEQQRKNRYWVKIQAHVLVPNKYSNEEEAPREALGEQMTNFVQKYPQGEINWGDGFITAYGKGQITDSGPNGEEKAARAAEVDAKAHLLEIVNDIAVDDRSKTGQDQRISFAMEGFVQGTQVVARSKSGTSINVTVQAPIRGVTGMTMTVYGFYTPEPPIAVVTPKPKPKPKPPKEKETQPQTTTAPPVAQAPTGVVIDARNVSANAALFPKIEDPKKREVYGVKQVNLDDLKKRGMAAYAVVSRDVQISRLFPHALIVAVRYPAPHQQERRQGEHPLISSAVSAGGKLQSILVVSEEDALKISEAEDALKEGRVVIVFSNDSL